MPHKPNYSNYIYNSPWDAPKKQNSRWITVINLYKEIFRRESIPDDLQFWSLCGAHTNENKPIKGEIGHLLEHGLIKEHQYFGVDREDIIIERNKTHFPNINWIKGDFIEVIRDYIIAKNFKPAIINNDNVMQPRNSVMTLKKIMTLLDYNVPNQVMLVNNFVLTNPYNPSSNLQYEINDVIDYLKEIYWIPNHWELYPEAYLYSYSQAKMGILIFIKKEHDINNIKY
jgi:hypothetical protein